MAVELELESALAMPKSISFTAPSKEISTFCGLTSRWMMFSGVPLWSFLVCAYSSALQTSRITRTAMGISITSLAFS